MFFTIAFIVSFSPDFRLTLVSFMLTVVNLQIRIWYSTTYQDVLERTFSIGESIMICFIIMATIPMIVIEKAKNEANLLKPESAPPAEVTLSVSTSSVETSLVEVDQTESEEAIVGALNGGACLIRLESL